MIQKIFSVRLKALRKAAGLTQTELGKSVGASWSVIRHLESGKQFTDINTFLSIAEYFSVTTDYLLGRTDDPHKNEINPKSKIA